MRRLCVLAILMAVTVIAVTVALRPAAGLALADSPSSEYVLFAWDGTLVAHSVQHNTTIQFDTAPANLAAIPVGYDVYSLQAAPITPPLDDYGFFHGVWSPDRTRFVYLEIAPPYYRVWLHTTTGYNQMLINNQFHATRGYLDPVGWTATGEIVLLERALLNHLPAVQVWRLDPATLALNYHTFMPVDRLSGRSALLPDTATVFLGYNLAQHTGYLLDITSGQVRTFPAQLEPLLPPARGFQTYPLQVLGALTENDLNAFAGQWSAHSATPESPALPAPFLHWPLPDDKRHITCYPDSPWTDANFDLTCPGLSAPRDYEGHQGTDISDRPDGLPPGTPVYPSAPGVVVATYRECRIGSPSCNGAYGNTVTLEHIRVINGEIQVWYTGYGHLQTVLVDNYAYLDALTEPLALSGATGVGGPHLHFEVRNSGQWVDPWDNRAGPGLWIGSNAHPQAVNPTVTTTPTGSEPAALTVCASITGNNIRSGPGTAYNIVGKTARDTAYPVLDVAFVDSGEATGDWYHVRFEGGDGWLWARLLDCR